MRSENPLNLQRARSTSHELRRRWLLRRVSLASALMTEADSPGLGVGALLDDVLHPGKQNAVASKQSTPSTVTIEVAAALIIGGALREHTGDREGRGVCLRTKDRAESYTARVGAVVQASLWTLKPARASALKANLVAAEEPGVGETTWEKQWTKRR